MLPFLNSCNKLDIPYSVPQYVLVRLFSHKCKSSTLELSFILPLTFNYISDTCNADTSFLCADLTCIHKSKVCDNYVNCIDGRDERVCEQPFTSCYDHWLNGYRKNVTIEADGRFCCKNM